MQVYVLIFVFKKHVSDLTLLQVANKHIRWTLSSCVRVENGKRYIILVRDAVADVE